MKKKLTAVLLVVALALSLGLVPVASVGANPGPATIWQIGDFEPIPPNSSAQCNDEFKTSSWSGIESWTYDVDESVVVQDASTFPSQLYVSGFTGNTSRGVHEVTIEFTLPHWYYDVELEYARLGAETNQVTLDGGTPVSFTGPGEGSQTSHILSLGNLAQGDHEIVIACTDAAGAPGNHYVDAVKLTGGPLIIEKELTDPALDPDTNDNGIGEVDMATPITFTMVITVTNQTGIDLTDVVAHDRLGAELYLDSATESIGMVTTWTKGWSKKWFIDWTIANLDDGDSETLTIVATTDINPGKGKGKIHQEYTSPGIYDLNSGAAIVSVTIDEEVIEVDSQTPPIKVEAVGEDED